MAIMGYAELKNDLKRSEYLDGDLSDIAGKILPIINDSEDSFICVTGEGHWVEVGKMDVVAWIKIGMKSWRFT